MTNKERYKIFCETEGSRIPLFLQYWWMETVCHGKEWDVALAFDGNHIVAALPYLLRRRAGLRYVLQPQLTPYNGPYYAYPATATTALQRRTFEREAARSLLVRLGELRLDYFQQNFSPLVTDWLPFHWDGYSQTTRYTYRLPDIGDPDALFAGIKSGRRRRIRRQLPQVHLVEETDVEAFVQLRRRYWQSRNRRDVVGDDMVRRVCHAALQRGQGKLLSLRDSEERTLGTKFLVYDDRCAYALMSAKEPAIKHNSLNAMDALTWLAIQHMSAYTKAYDFEGSMDYSIGHVNSDFGGELVPFFSIERCRNPLFRLVLSFKH